MCNNSQIGRLFPMPFTLDFYMINQTKTHVFLLILHHFMGKFYYILETKAEHK